MVRALVRPIVPFVPSSRYRHVYMMPSQGARRIVRFQLQTKWLTQRIAGFSAQVYRSSESLHWAVGRRRRIQPANESRDRLSQGRALTTTHHTGSNARVRSGGSMLNPPPRHGQPFESIEHQMLDQQPDHDHRREPREHAIRIQLIAVLEDVTAEPALPSARTEHEPGGDQRELRECPADAQSNEDRRQRDERSEIEGQTAAVSTKERLPPPNPTRRWPSRTLNCVSAYRAVMRTYRPSCV